MKKQDEMQRMNMLLSSRNAFAITAILIAAFMIYSMIKGDYRSEIQIIMNIMIGSFWGSMIYYSNKRDGKDFFRSILPIALIVLITALIILFGMWMLR